MIKGTSYQTLVIFDNRKATHSFGFSSTKEFPFKTKGIPRRQEMAVKMVTASEIYDCPQGKSITSGQPAGLTSDVLVEPA